MSRKSIFWEKYHLIIYTAVLSVFIILAASWLTVFLVGTLGNPFWENSPTVVERGIMLPEKKVKRYPGEWEVAESKTGHHNSIGRGYEPDKWTFCIKCHGPAPHSRTPKERDFLNMHSTFMSCYICHIREQEDVATTNFGWMNLTSGQLCSSPNMDKGVWGEYGAKIVPLNTGENLQPLKLEAEEALAVKLHKEMGLPSEHQKMIRNKFIHRRCIDTPVHCVDCHNSEKAFLPYTALGYTAQRAAFLVSPEVAGFAGYYETFNVPKPLIVDANVPEVNDNAGK